MDTFRAIVRQHTNGTTTYFTYQWWSLSVVVSGLCMRAGIGMTINFLVHPVSVIQHCFNRNNYTNLFQLFAHLQFIN